MIKITNSSDEIKKCIPVLIQLRTTLTEKQCLDQIVRQLSSGYNLAYVEENKKIVAVAGFRILECLAYGKFLYIDDLIVDSSSRSTGYGGILFDFLIKHAEKENCNELHLDSGVQRFDAHRFYLRRYMNITAHHFGINFNT